jgi:hypothetical protein
MLTLLLLKVLPARAAAFVQKIAEAIEEAQELRRQMHRKHRMGFDG